MRMVVVCIGYSRMMKVPPETRKHIESEGIQLIVKKTAEAWKNFNHIIKFFSILSKG